MADFIISVINQLLVKVGPLQIAARSRADAIELAKKIATAIEDHTDSSAAVVEEE